MTKVVRVLIGLVALLGVVGVTAVSGGAAPANATVRELFDPGVIRDFRLELEPLAGWRPAPDWTPPEGWPGFPEGWDSTMTDAEKDAFVAADPVLRPLAVAAAWDTIRFDLTNAIVVKARFAEVGADGEVVPGSDLLVGVRRKSSRALPSEADPRKIGMKVGFNDFVSGQTYKGVSKLSLENAGDVSVLHEGMAWQVHQAASVAGFYGEGYDPALASWSTVSVNGEYLGVYTNVEQRNKQFLRNRSLWNSGRTWMYKQDDIGMPEFDEGPTLGDGTPVQSQAFNDLCFAPFRPTTGEWAATCAVPTDGMLDDVLDAEIDMQVMLTQGALDAFLVNDDALLTKGKNFFFVDRLDASGNQELRRHYPWDLDAVFRAEVGNIYAVGKSTNKRGVVSYSQSEFQQLILNHPVYRARYNQIVLGLLDGPLSAANVDALFARVSGPLKAAMATDPYLPDSVRADIDGHVTSLRNWFTTRSTAVRSQVAANVPAPRKADATAPTVGAPTLSAGTVVPDAEVTVTATVTDNAEVVGADVRVGTAGTWAPMTATDGSFGGTSEVVTATFTAPSADGSYPICVRGTDSSANTGSAVCTTLKVETPKVTTTLVYGGPTSVKVNTAIALSATLTTGNGPVAGATVQFVLNKVTYTATTGGDGVASVTAKAITKAGPYPLTVSYAGGVGYTAASTGATVTVVR